MATACFVCIAGATCQMSKVPLCERCRRDLDGSDSFEKIVESYFPIEAPIQLVSVCREWHGGQASSMYSVLSTGVVYDEATLIGLTSELRSALRASKGSTIIAEWLDWTEDRSL